MVSPDFMFLFGILILMLAFPAVLAAFSSSNRSFRPAILCLVVGCGLIVLAAIQNPKGYSIADVPRIAADLVN